MGVLTLLLVFLRLPGVPFLASRNGQALPLQTVIHAGNRSVLAVAVHPACGSTAPLLDLERSDWFARACRNTFGEENPPSWKSRSKMKMSVFAFSAKRGKVCITSVFAKMMTDCPFSLVQRAWHEIVQFRFSSEHGVIVHIRLFSEKREICIISVLAKW